MGDLVKEISRQKKYKGLNRIWSPRNYLINPHLQFKIVFLLGGIAAVTSAVICYIAYERLIKLGALFNHSVIPPVAAPAAFKAIADSMMIRLGAIVIGVIGTFCLAGLVLTHRVAGPIWKVRAQLKKFLEGEEIGTIKFRKRDEFQDLPDLINKLVAGYKGPRGKA
jgi:hypothetical protein